MEAIKIPRFCGLVEGKTICKTISRAPQAPIQSHVCKANTGSYKSTHTITQSQYIHTEMYTPVLTLVAQWHIHLYSFKNTLINNQTHWLREHQVKILEYILIDKYKKLHWKTQIRRPLYICTNPHTQRHRPMDEHTGKIQTRPLHSWTYHRVNTNTAGRGTHVLQVFTCMQTHMHRHTRAHPPSHSIRLWTIPGSYLPLQLNWVPLSPLLLSGLLPFLGSLLSNVFARSISPSSSHGWPFLVLQTSGSISSPQ